LVWWLEIDEG